jgi:hypothetical protein
MGMNPAFKSFGGVVGTLVSALFLFGIAVANIFVLISIWRTFQTVKNGARFVKDDLDLALANRGLLGRSMSDELAAELADFMANYRYDNRSEAVRDLARLDLGRGGSRPRTLSLLFEEV